MNPRAPSLTPHREGHSMTRPSRTAAILFALFTTTGLGGCACIFGGGTSQSIALRGDPTSIHYSIRAASGIQLSSGQTPNQVTLPRKQEYEIEFTASGYQPQKLALTKGMNGWVWTN